MAPTISVLIPAYNEEKVIQSTVVELNDHLSSLKTREILDSYEIIVCINGTVDRTGEIVERLSFFNKRKRYGASFEGGN